MFRRRSAVVGLGGLGLLASLPAPVWGAWTPAQDIRFKSAGSLAPGFWALEAGMLRNQERQCFTADNVSVEDGFLRIEARRERVANPAYRAGARGWREATAFAEYSSGSVVTRQAFLFGRFEVRARCPGGAGVWPAIWLLHESAGHYGEIDIHESVGKHPDTAFAGVHYGRDPATRDYKSANRRVPGLDGAWHTHTLEWTPERITVSLDGQPLMVFDPRDAMTAQRDPLRRPMRLHINLALGGTWGGPIDDRRLPARMDIESVRIWQWSPGGAEALAPPPLAQADAPLPVPRWGR